MLLPLLPLLPLPIACQADPVLLSVPVAVAASPATLTLDDDVSVALDTAELTLADLRLEAPAQTASLAAPLVPALLLGTARAHPGHEGAGETSGELLGTWTVDLLAGEPTLGDAAAYEGTYATASLDLPGDVGVLLEGTATVGGSDRPFSIALVPDGHVSGIPFDAELSSAAPPGGLTLAVDLAHALSFIDWSTADQDADGALTDADGDVAATAAFGVLSTPTYTLSLED